MKNLSLLKKATLLTLVGLPLALGLGFTTKQNSQGLESRIPSIGMNTAQAKEENPEGYEVPDLTGLTPYAKGFLKSEPKVFVERFFTKDGGRAARFSYDNGKERKTFAYAIDSDKVAPGDYTIYDGNGDSIFESKYNIEEEFDVPEWAKA
ncbi:MAG: hypothetical protein KKA79_04550 [Nanoarchaeota archaeon]|nr:hypothetical protein [Nanoarchaeota archaeon]